MIELDQLLRQNPPPTKAVRDLGTETTRRAFERFPRLYVRFARRRNPHRPLIDSSTDAVIEGFPRSGNTFLLSWITLANPELKVASHLHSVAHLRAGLKQKTPVVVLLRSPTEAMTSELLNRIGRGDPLSFQQVFRRYERFYQGAKRYRDDVIISPFETTTKQPELVVRALNERTGWALDLEPLQKENEVLADVERLNTLHVGEPNELTVARPSESRAELAARIKQELAENHTRTLSRLQDLHDTLASSATAIR